MEPAINVGDMVLAGPSRTGGIKPGVIISYEAGKNLITHRVLSIDGNTLIPKGMPIKSRIQTPSGYLRCKAGTFSGSICWVRRGLFTNPARLAPVQLFCHPLYWSVFIGKRYHQGGKQE